MGRGSSKLKGVKYGTEFKTVLESGNIKFIKFNGNNSPSPDYTEKSGRVYVLVNQQNKLKSIIYFGKNGKRKKQIDLDKPHFGRAPHTHKGYKHDEKGTFPLSSKEEKMVERITKTWYYHITKSKL